MTPIFKIKGEQNREMETVPAQIGTCGTIQFLISREIDFFTNFESSNKALNNGGNGIASTSRVLSTSREQYSSEDLNRHKRVNRKALNNKGNSTGARILPRICSSVDVIATSARVQVRRPIQN